MAYLEEKSHNKHLQSPHGYDKAALNQAEVYDPLFCATDGAEVSVFAGSEILLVSGNGRQLSRDLVERFFQSSSLLGAASLLGRQVDARLILDLNAASVSLGLFSFGQGGEGAAHSDLEVDELLGVGAHVIVEAELVLSGLVGGEDKVALAFLLAIEDDLRVGAGYFVVDVERTSRLDLRGQSSATCCLQQLRRTKVQCEIDPHTAK